MFGSHEYSREELIAEMGSAFLAGHCGIETATLADAASYIANWLRVLKDDRRMVVLAAGQAQKAADCILGPKHGDEPHQEMWRDAMRRVFREGRQEPRRRQLAVCSGSA